MLSRVFLLACVACCCASPAYATWPGANGLLLFDNRRDLFTLDPWTGETRQLTDTPGSFERVSTGSWSPDGKRIAYTRHTPHGEREGVFTLHVMNADGSGSRQLSGGYTTRAAWTPDGRYVLSSGGDPHPFRVPWRGGIERSLGHDGWAFSPDGRLTLGGWALRGANGRFLRWAVGEEEWHPNSTLTAGTVRWPPNFEQGLIVSRDLFTGRTTPLFPVGQEPIYFAWSPDGRRLAVKLENETRGSDEIGVLELASGQFTVLYSGPSAGEVSWQPRPVDRQPVCRGAEAVPAELPANGRLSRVVVRGVRDPDGDPVRTVITQITQNQAREGSQDARLERSGAARVEAWRLGGVTRVYRLEFSGSDGHGPACFGATRVLVPGKPRPNPGRRLRVQSLGDRPPANASGPLG